MSKAGDKPIDMLQEHREGETGKGTPLNETWSQDAQDELEDFIEQQGIYIRQ